jgi:4-amino-4-deoxy-L-arabinose transferase-like glycosyltransferase
VWAVLLLLTIGGFLIRAQRLRGPEGTLGEDEARLVLAANGVLATGLPVMPSGKIYLRGAVNSYLTAGSLWLFGRRDFAARLPNTIGGTLLIPLLFIFGRALGGIAAGFCLAVFAAVQPELVRWSTSAWMTSLFIVFFVGAAYLLYLGYERDQPRMQLAGSVASIFGVLAHELGALLALAVILALAIRMTRQDLDWFGGSNSAAALMILGLSLALFVALGLFLRTGTVAGSAGEFKHYFGPSLSLNRFLLDYDRWWPGYLLLVAAAVLGIPLLLRSLKSGGLFLYVTIAVTGFTIWVVIAKSSERYGLVLLPLLALIATWAIAEGVHLISGWWQIRPRAAQGLRATLCILVFGVSLHKDVIPATRWLNPPTQTWLTEFQALGASPNDLVISDNPEAPTWYLGRVDYWERWGGYQRYSYVFGNQVRHFYTGAVRVGSWEDFLGVVRANPGKTLWYVGGNPALRELAPNLRDKIFRASRFVMHTHDGLMILRIDLNAPDLVSPDGDRAIHSEQPS